jgi:glycosyltransferase involved in cell wall biosynthesis
MNVENGVSYIISTKNRSQFLAKTLDNVREFITQEDELIIVDGGSTDGTIQLIEENQDIVTVFKSESDLGEAHGFNKAILFSRGRIIKPIADDDYFYPEAMRYAINVLKTNPDLDAIQCGGESYIFDQYTNKLTLALYRYLPEDKQLANIKNIYNFVPCGLGLFLTRDGIAKAGLFDVTFRMVDVEYLSKLLLTKANIRYLNIKLYRHITYEHSGGSSRAGIDRDQARIYMRLGEWDALINGYRYDVGDVLGITGLPGGEFLIKCIFILEKLRKKTPGLYKRLNNVNDIRNKFLNYFLHLNINPLDNLENKVFTSPHLSKPIIEPNWDGSLRD